MREGNRAKNERERERKKKEEAITTSGACSMKEYHT